MKSARRRRLRASSRLLPSSVFRSISITISLVLIVTSLVFSPIVMASLGQQSNGQERRGTPLPPRPGAPAAMLPNLDELRAAASRSQSESRIEAPAPIPSTMRSRRKQSQLLLGTTMTNSFSPRTIDRTYESKRRYESASRDSRIAIDRKGSRYPQPTLHSHHARSNRQKESGYRSPELLIAAVQSGGATENVVWTNVVGASVSGNNLTKTSGDGWGNAGAASTQSIVSGDGYVESTISETSTWRMIGLSQGDSDQNYTDIDFAIYPTGTGSGSHVYVYESGVYRGDFGPYATGDLLRVAVEGGLVKYRKNGSLLYTSTVAPSYPLLVDTSLYSNGSTINSVVISGNLNTVSTQNVIWTNASGVSVSGNSLTKTSSDGWGNAGAASTQSIVSGDGYVESTISETSTWRMIGLSQGDSDQNYTDIDFAIYPTGTGSGSHVYVYESGVYRGDFGPYATGDLLRVAVEGGVVKYRKNGTLLYTSTVAPSYPLLVDTSLYSNGSTINSVVISGNLSGSGGGGSSDFPMARIDPRNRTGTGGEDLLSNNFNWSLPLIGLPGRGLDLGLTLSYNSLVWTRSGNYIDFDLDAGSISPGFRLGFPVIEGPYWNPDVSGNFYLLLTPSGGRVELRQVGNSIVYESKDSTYLQLIDNLNGTLTLRPTDGSQMNFIIAGGGWRCNQIKDRNGNFITATYKSWGELETVTDTLGRVLTFNYDGNDNLQSVTQSWNGQTHEWATFGWSTAEIGNNFPGLNNLGPNSTSIPVLTQVGLSDGSRYNFEYNNSYGMVSTIRHYAHDPANTNHQRNYTTYVTPSSATDCPRLTERRVWAEAWTGVNGVPTEVATQYTHDGDGGCRVTLPDGTVHKEYYGSGWQTGLTTETRSYATAADANSNAWQKRTTTTWTQENVNVSYLMNPRVTETNVYDASGNRRRTTIDYGAYSQWGLPYIVKEYAGDGTTELRRSQTDYNLSQAYLSQRIIGLVSTSQLYDAVANQWQAKATYNYDGNSIDSQATAATQHDQTYSSTFTTRGNVTSVSRWDVTDIDNGSKALTSTLTYNAAGSVLTSSDPAGHTNRVEYADAFSDNQNHNTFAYPTTLKDADNFSSTIQYNFDFGAKTRVQGPPPAGQSQGVIQTMLYESAGRIERVTTQNNGAYTRYVYGPNYRLTFATVNNVADDAYTVHHFDGLGRAFATAGFHPGSAGGFKAQLTYHDAMGRVMKQSNPTEIRSDWLPWGDDAAGYQYNNPTEYDWQGRVTKTYNMDGTYKTAAFSGCGCAGGEVVTLTDEVGRRTKAFSDVLGRSWKTEILNWDGSVYSTTTNTLNARDQVTLVRQWVGAENGGGTSQETTINFDGYGRVQSKHAPEQNAGTATTWEYNNDDTLHKVTDARGASATYVYNNGRHLVNEINYSAPSGITPTSNVTFAYDAAGNRTLMTDGPGSVSYNYNDLSRMTSETRTFNSVGSFTLGYDYNLAGELKRITDATNMTINYGFDSSGRLNSVTGSDNLFMGISNYASNFQYRAWGGLKAMTSGDNRATSVLYNAKLQPTHFEVNGLVSQNYSYHNDGRVSFVQNTTDANFDRSYSYDHMARLGGATTGGVARGDSGATPYNEGFGYDAFNNLNSRSTVSWGQDEMWDWAAYTNNRRSGWGYDANGNNTTIGTRSYQFDAAGQMTQMNGQRWVANNYITVSQGAAYDGDGTKVKEVVDNNPTYYLRSSVLEDAIIEEINGSGQKSVGYVYSPDGVPLARQSEAGANSYITWKHATPAGTGEHDLNVGYVFGSGTPQRVELDPLGASVPLEYTPPPEVQNEGDVGQIGGIFDARWSNFFDLSGGCSANGVMASCSGNQSPDAYMESQMREFFGDKWYDLPGNNNERERAERDYERRLAYTRGRNGIVPRTREGYLRGTDLNFQPQNPAPGGLSLQNHLKMNRAFADASSALARPKRGRNPCLDFFSQGRSLAEVSKIFKNLWDTVTANPYSAPSIAGTVNSGQGMDARLNLYAPFFADTGETQAGMLAGYHWEPARGRYEELFTSLTPRQYRALTILHEFAHALGLIPSDKNDKRAMDSQSQKNDELIYEKCGKFLASLPAQ